MSFSVPPYVPSVVWQDQPSTATPLDSAVLNAEIQHFATYVENTLGDLADYATAYADQAIVSGFISTISMGDTSGAFALDMSSGGVTICGTGRLVGDTVITATGFATGSRAEILLIQDPVGGHAVSLVANGVTIPLVVPSSGAMTIRLTCADLDLNLFADVSPALTALATVVPFWTGAIAALVNNQLDTTVWPYQSVAAGHLSVLTDPLGTKGTVLQMAITETG